MDTVVIKNSYPFVKLGSHVRMLLNGETREFQIVKPEDVDIDNHKFSCEAPLMQLIMGLQIGQTITGQIGGKTMLIKVELVSVN